MPRTYRAFIERGLSPNGARTLALSEQTPFADVAAALRQILDLVPDLDQLDITVDGRTVGATSPGQIIKVENSRNRGYGDGDRALLPGTSTRYQLLVFGCGQCTRDDYAVDATLVPLCPGHGPMTLRLSPADPRSAGNGHRP